MTIIIVLFVLATVFGFGEKIQQLQEWIQNFGTLSILVFSIIYIIAVIAAFPGTALGFIAGSLFGSITGIILVSVLSTIGAAITFLLARYLARNAVTRWLSHHETYKRLDTLVEKHGMIIVALTRLIPFFPFNILNYGFGLTKVSFRTYIFWSWLCMLPGIIIIVGSADAVTHGITEGMIPWTIVAVVSCTFILLLLLMWYARHLFKEKEKSSQQYEKRKD